MIQRHCVIELDASGNTVREIRFKKTKSPWTLDHGLAMRKSGQLSEAHPEAAGFEVVTEEFEPIEVDPELPEPYREWIITNVLDTADGLCLEWAGLMAQAFPELELVHGYFEAGDQSQRWGHFWCERRSDRLVVDPTVQQFQDPKGYQMMGRSIEPEGRCVICGGPTYMGWECCSVYCWCEKDPPYKQKLTKWVV